MTDAVSFRRCRQAGNVRGADPTTLMRGRVPVLTPARVAVAYADATAKSTCRTTMTTVT